MVKTEWMVIANPKAGSNRVLDEWPIISEQLSNFGIEYEVIFSKHKYHSVELAVKAIREGYRKLIAVGGDGTIHEVVNGIFFQKEVDTSEITLAVIPAGSGNDWMKMYDVTTDYKQSVGAIAGGKTIFQDICKVDVVESMVPQTRYMINVAGVGYDAMICHYCNKMKEDGKTGAILYVKSAVKSFFKIRAKVFKVIVDGKEFFKGRVFSTAFGIGRYSGGGMSQVPDAVVNDGLVNLTIIEKIPKLSIILNFGKLFKGSIYTIKGVYHTVGKRISIFSEVDDSVEVDGEVIGTTPLELSVLPQALRVVVGENFSLNPPLL
jgi:YegS/Rv2252/BmrU family lipid kinase